MNKFYRTTLAGLSLIVELCLQCSVAGAITIRDDTPDAKYRVAEGFFPALADLPIEGHGTLIAPQWVVTAAHATVWEHIAYVTVAGTQRPVDRIVVNSGYRKPPMKFLMGYDGDAAPLEAALAESDDIALIHLTEPVLDVKPVPIYRGSDELGNVVEIIGKGATGNGLTGEAPNASHRGELRRAYNRIVSAEGRWLGYRFDAPPNAMPLEGVLGHGDSGGPVLMQVNGHWTLVGLADRAFWVGPLSKFKQGIYGQMFFNTRVSHYASWLDEVMARK
jgi:chymotrypsin